jgi:prepilin-type N-terminal cleavage/methylation domain-containing protein
MDRMIRKQSHGFTLIELLAVMGIMVLMMALSMGAFMDWTRNSGMKGCVLNIKSTLNGARQLAITRRVRTTVYYGNSKGIPAVGYYYASNRLEGVIGQTNWLARGVQFDLAPPNYSRPITFNFDGSCTNEVGALPLTIRIVEAGRGGSASTLWSDLQIYPLTGRIKLKSGG